MARNFLGESPGLEIGGIPVYPGYQTASQTSTLTTSFQRSAVLQRRYRAKVLRHHLGGALVVFPPKRVSESNRFEHLVRKRHSNVHYPTYRGVVFVLLGWG